MLFYNQHGRKYCSDSHITNIIQLTGRKNIFDPLMSSSSSARISITSDEVNLLVYRYLVEAGMIVLPHILFETYRFQAHGLRFSWGESIAQIS